MMRARFIRRVLPVISALVACNRVPVTAGDRGLDAVAVDFRNPLRDHLLAPKLVCSKDIVEPTATRGSMVLSRVTDIVPLCDGWILAAEPDAQRVRYLNVLSGDVNATYTFFGQPTRLSLDANAGKLYVTRPNDAQLACLDLADGQVSYIGLPFPAVAVAVLDRGSVFAYLKEPGTAKDLYAFVDSSTGTTTTTDAQPTDWLDSPVVAWNAVLGRMFMAGQHGPSTLLSGAVDMSTLTLKVDQRTTATADPLDLRVSPDAMHLVWTADHNDPANKRLPDLSPHDVTTVVGYWPVRYPTGVDFVPDSSQLAVASIAVDDFLQVKGNQISLLGTADHSAETAVATLPPEPALGRVRVSRGGRLVLVLDAPSNASSTALHWFFLR